VDVGVAGASIELVDDDGARMHLVIGGHLGIEVAPRSGDWPRCALDPHVAIRCTEPLGPIDPTGWSATGPRHHHPGRTPSTGQREIAVTSTLPQFSLSAAPGAACSGPAGRTTCRTTRQSIASPRGSPLVSSTRRPRDVKSQSRVLRGPRLAQGIADRPSPSPSPSPTSVPPVSGSRSGPALAQ
jgi:hypothetical protein